MHILKNVRFISNSAKNLTIKFRNTYPVSFDQNRIQYYLLPVPEKFNNIFYKIRIAFTYPLEKVHPFMLLCNTRTETAKYMECKYTFDFSLDFSNQTSKLLFTILHVWFIHRGFNDKKLETRKLLIWELLWDHMRDLIIMSDIDRDSYEHNLVEMQSKTVGLCLSFDEAFDFYFENGDPSLIKKTMFETFYKNYKEPIGSDKLDKLTFYAIMMESFMCNLPERELKYALFQWPEFDFTSK